MQRVRRNLKLACVLITCMNQFHRYTSIQMTILNVKRSGLRSGGQLQTNRQTKCELISSRLFHYMPIFATAYRSMSAMNLYPNYIHIYDRA